MIKNPNSEFSPDCATQSGRVTQSVRKYPIGQLHLCEVGLLAYFCAGKSVCSWLAG